MKTDRLVARLQRDGGSVPVRPLLSTAKFFKAKEEVEISVGIDPVNLFDWAAKLCSEINLQFGNTFFCTLKLFAEIQFCFIGPLNL